MHCIAGPSLLLILLAFFALHREKLQSGDTGVNGLGGISIIICQDVALPVPRIYSSFLF